MNDRLLIVDDEPLYRKAIKEIIDWKSLGFDEPEEAINGEDALSRLSQSNFGLVITDIKMPKMDGLELIREAHQQKIDSHFIVLSAYDDFKLVKKAFQIGCLDYLLKHQISQDEVSRIINNYRDRQKAQDSSDTQKERLYQRDFLASLLREEKVKESDVCQVMEIPSFKEGGRIYTAKGRIHVEQDIDGAYLYQLIEDIAYQIPSLYTIQHNQDVTFFYVTKKPLSWRELDSFWSFVGSLWSDGISSYGGSLSIGFQNKYSDISQIRQTIEEGSSCLDWYTVRGQGSIISPPRLQIKASPVSLPDVKKLSQQLILATTEESIAILDKIKLDPYTFGWFSPSQIRSYFHSTASHIKASLEALGFSDNSHLLDMFYQSQRQINDWDIKQFNRTVDKIIDFYKTTTSLPNRLVGDIVQYIKEHYKEALTLGGVAEHFELNPSYLSRLFKKEVGGGFAQYLAEIRIKSAVSIMNAHNLRISELAVLVGIPQPETFCRVFKRVKGMSPKQYLLSLGKKVTD
ncbi:response regulator transcription factor [Spirochaeta cellobiosiphila]|uniref:response regulator transcription factor n=1 Tax=Spirochaeta cellobiosiphila TaxID=504483 RepID=UPI00042226CB|nr:response regulator [Spirochaeta cellobiosiphila]